MSKLPSVYRLDDAEDPPTTILTAPKAAVTSCGFEVRVMEGPDRGQTGVLSGDDFTVGTSKGNDLVLTDRSASSHHLVIAATPDGFDVRDLDSTNGTFVDDVRVRVAYLSDGCSLRVGITRLGFRVLSDTVTRSISVDSNFGPLVGASEPMRRLFAVLPRVAKSDATTLILGETGTGKTALARAIHEASVRAPEPFVLLDCGAVTPTLIESELFGHDRGAFTGADRDREGAFEQAKGGTLLLDEIGELPLHLQPKLLSALESREFKRVGGNQTRQVRCRILAASNRDLRREVNSGKFRDDLFFRLNVVALQLAPLRERLDDIPLLVKQCATRCGESSVDLAPLIAAWSERRWPGNVRELQSAVERALLFGDHPPMPSEFPPPPSSNAPALTNFDASYREAKTRAIAQWEAAYLSALLNRHDGNLSAAAREVDMDRNYLRARAQKLGIL